MLGCLVVGGAVVEQRELGSAACIKLVEAQNGQSALGYQGTALHVGRCGFLQFFMHLGVYPGKDAPLGGFLVAVLGIEELLVFLGLRVLQKGYQFRGEEAMFLVFLPVILACRYLLYSMSEVFLPSASRMGCEVKYFTMYSSMYVSFGVPAIMLILFVAPNHGGLSCR